MVSEDEDLEFLRLAALQSRKHKEAQQQAAMSHPNFDQPMMQRPYRNPRHKKPMRGRLNRNFQGHIKSSRVNTNLISIPTAPLETTTPEIRPDAVKTKTEPSQEEASSKFRRYEHSDRSDTESETEAKKSEPEEADEILQSEPTTPTKARSERGDSLDRLINELENEIAGTGKTGIAKKSPKKVKKVKVMPVPKKEEFDENIVIKMEPEEDDDVVDTTVIPPPIDLESKDEPEEAKEEPVITPKIEPVEEKVSSPKTSPVKDSPKRKSPIHKSPVFRRSRSPLSPRPLYPRVLPLSPRPLPYKRAYSPRPLSPLVFDTDVLNAITMAPLSPVSAAFVLENRKIIAKRKMSPRSVSSSSSYRSRSRSPIRKRSISPYSRSRYTPPRRYSPPPRRRSISPKRSDLPPRRRSPERTYKRRSFSPRSVRSPSPRRKRRSRSPVNRAPRSPKPTIRNRLGPRTNPPPPRKEVKPAPRRPPSRNSISLSPSPTRRVSPKPVAPTSPLDPVLEARRRKFESNKPIDVAEGIIKLTVDKENEEVEEILAEPEKEIDLSDAEDIICVDVTDFQWSSEESDNDNESRFKVAPRKVSVTQPAEPRKRKRSRDRSHRNHRKSHKEIKLKRNSDEPERKVNRKVNKILIRGERGVNEVEEVKDAMRIVVSDKKRDKVSRKVTEVNKSEEGGTPPVETKKVDEYEPEIIFEGDTGDEVAAASDDLRAELSRRRAQRTKQSNLPIGPPTRLLQTAFQDMTKKPVATLSAIHKPKKTVRQERGAEVKLPIHLRLGTSENSDGDIKKKSKLGDNEGRKKRLLGLQV